MFEIFLKSYFDRHLGRCLWFIIKIFGFEFGFPIRFMIAFMLWDICTVISTFALIDDSFPQPIFFPTLITMVLYVYSMVVILHPWFWRPVFLALSLWTIILLEEIAGDLLYSARYWFQSRRRIRVRRPWKLTALLKSANNGYFSSQFYPVTEVDSSKWDDPFWPNVSSIFMVEIRRRCLIWRTITIWQVSMFDGGRKKVHVFHDTFKWTDGNLFGRNLLKWKDTIKCFKSNGVIFVVWRNRQRGSTKFYVYDHRYQKSGSYEVPMIYSRFRRSLLCVRCLGRHVDNDRSVNGWRIRIFVEMWERPRAVIESSVLDLRDGKARLVNVGESIAFGNFTAAYGFLTIKSAEGLFGLYAKRKHLRYGKAMMFNPLDGRFDRQFRWSQEEEIREPHFDRYYALDAPNKKHLLSSAPTVINPRECILAYKDGAVFRTQLGVPSSLKYLAAKALFRAEPNPRHRMAAGQFRQLSGISGMEGNFD